MDELEAIACTMDRYIPNGLGLEVLDEWKSLNKILWGNVLKPIPITASNAMTYGRCIGFFSYAGHSEIRIKSSYLQRVPQDTWGTWKDILFHEMIHQYLEERGDDCRHNSVTWCNEIMRLGSLIWDVNFWASPSSPRKINGQSVRIQKRSPSGEESIPMKDISAFPHSLRLTIDTDNPVGKKPIYKPLLRRVAHSSDNILSNP